MVIVRARRHMGTQRVSTSSLPNCPTLVQVISLTSNNQGHVSREGCNPGSYDHKSKLDIILYTLKVWPQQEAMTNWERKNGLFTPRSQRKGTVTLSHSRQNDNSLIWEGFLRLEHNTRKQWQWPQQGGKVFVLPYVLRAGSCICSWW